LQKSPYRPAAGRAGYIPVNFENKNIFFVKNENKKKIKKPPLLGMQQARSPMEISILFGWPLNALAGADFGPVQPIEPNRWQAQCRQPQKL
jgi:hypothetical protein